MLHCCITNSTPVPYLLQVIQARLAALEQDNHKEDDFGAGSDDEEYELPAASGSGLSGIASLHEAYLDVHIQRASYVSGAQMPRRGPPAGGRRRKSRCGAGRSSDARGSNDAFWAQWCMLGAMVQEGAMLHAGRKLRTWRKLCRVVTHCRLPARSSLGLYIVRVASQVQLYVCHG